MKSLIVGAIFVVATIIGFVGYLIVVEFSAGPPLHVLLIGDADSSGWRQTTSGARFAAHVLKLELDIEMLDSDAQSREQINRIRELDVAKYDGVAFHSDGTVGQMDLINELAGRSKLVTIGDDVKGSKRLCHVAFSEFENGREIARTVREALNPGSWIVLLISSTPESDSDADGNFRLRGFQLEWEVTEQLGSTSTLRFFKAQGGQSSLSLTQDLLDATDDTDLDAIVAFDAQAANCVLAALAGRRHTRQVPVFAFDPTIAILDAIEDGRVQCAIRNDPFFCGYEAVRRLAIYAPKHEGQLPAAGYGEQHLVGERITRTNHRDVRRDLPN
jgi:ribose transport system substrate-binding protein